MFSSMLSLLGSLRGGSSFITNSLRFRSSAGAFLSRTFTAPTDRNKWTWSAWVKRGSLSATGTLLSSQTSGANWIAYFSTSDTLLIQTAATTRLQTSQVFRDPSAWYHLVVVYDAANPTANLRIRFYINGLEPTSYTTDARSGVASNQGEFNTAVNHFIGSGNGSFDGYLTEVNFIDGQALTPASFGAIDSSTGVWAPRPYSGTYGTNGFYLKFADASAATAAAIGKDSSGNGNNWTPNNISVTAGATYDSMIDVPVNYSDGGNGRGNYAVLNPLDTDAGTRSISRGNLQVTDTVSLGTWAAGASSIRMTTGKWYFEATGSGPVTTSPTTNSAVIVGVVGTATTGSIPGTTTPSVSYRTDGQKYVNNVVTAYGATFTTEIIGCAFDADARTVEFFKNNVSQGIISIDASNIGYTFCVSCAWATAGQTFIDANFGQRPFTYTPPAGFRALNTQNLPTPSIVNGANFMAATTYTGTAGVQSILNTVNSVSFQPDLVWIKSRTPGATNHALFDSVRGTTKYLSSNTTTTETTLAQSLTAFGADGFSLGTDTTLVNANANSYIAWQWKAGGAAVSNTQGTITSQVSANTTAGLSVVTYTGTGVNATVGHGLGVAPKMVIYKNRQSVGFGWVVSHSSLSSPSTYLVLNAPNGVATDGAVIPSAPSATTFSVGSNAGTNGSANQMIAYCFAEIAGFSKFGSYTGNALADGTFVYCGFRPRWILYKNSGTFSQWVVWDTARDPSNVVGKYLIPNTADFEVQNLLLDILSNGFKLRTTDASNNSGTMIFAAFAENPTKYALAR